MGDGWAFVHYLGPGWGVEVEGGPAPSMCRDVLSEDVSAVWVLPIFWKKNLDRKRYASGDSLGH